MGVTKGSIEFDNGRVNARYYCAGSDAVGVYLPISKSQEVVSTDDTRLLIRNGAVITDFIQGPATGTVQLEVDGDPIPIFIDLAAQGATNSGRKKLSIPVKPGSWLRVKVVATLAV